MNEADEVTKWKRRARLWEEIARRLHALLNESCDCGRARTGDAVCVRSCPLAGCAVDTVEPGALTRT